MSLQSKIRVLFAGFLSWVLLPFIFPFFSIRSASLNDNIFATDTFIQLMKNCADFIDLLTAPLNLFVSIFIPKNAGIGAAFIYIFVVAVIVFALNAIYLLITYLKFRKLDLTLIGITLILLTVSWITNTIGSHYNTMLFFRERDILSQLGQQINVSFEDCSNNKGKNTEDRYHFTCKLNLSNLPIEKSHYNDNSPYIEMVIQPSDNKLRESISSRGAFQNNDKKDAVFILDFTLLKTELDENPTIIRLEYSNSFNEYPIPISEDIKELKLQNLVNLVQTPSQSFDSKDGALETIFSYYPSLKEYLPREGYNYAKIVELNEGDTWYFAFVQYSYTSDSSGVSAVQNIFNGTCYSATYNNQTGKYRVKQTGEIDYEIIFKNATKVDPKNCTAQ
jgi:hypothetical protein